MATLPFVVQPRLKPILERIGTEESGQIEIERRGYLTSGEKSFVQQVQQQDGGTMQLVALSRKIARGRDMALEKAYNLTLEIMTGQTKSKLAQDVEAEYAEEIQAALQQLASSRLREDLVCATCLLTSRVDPNLAMEDIMELHPDIISGLAELYKEEEAKSIEKLQIQGDKPSKKVSVEEIEKKPKEEKTA